MAQAKARKEEFGTKSIDAGLCDSNVVVQGAKLAGLIIRFENVSSKGKGGAS